MKQTAIRYHDFCMGHRVVGHEGKCRHLHGHNYRIHFHCAAKSEELDQVGRVIDFSEIKRRLCEWIEEHWDHKFMAWKQDQIMTDVVGLFADHTALELPRQNDRSDLIQSVVWVDFNPTAENIAAHFMGEIAPGLLCGTGIILEKVILEETRKCSVECSL